MKKLTNNNVLYDCINVDIYNHIRIVLKFENQ